MFYVIAMNESWNLDRKPTAMDRGVGIVGAGLLFAAGAAALWFSITVVRNAWVSAVVGAFTAFSAFLLFRFTFTSGRKLQRSEISATAVAFTVAGLGMLIGSFFASGAKEKFMLLSLGISGVGGGVFNFSRAKKEPKPSEPMTPSDRGSSRTFGKV